ncbi:MAG: type IV secretory system conjugative DNA transfer family protein [Candidatus Dormibacterales bacterium]
MTPSLGPLFLALAGPSALAALLAGRAWPLPAPSSHGASRWARRRERRRLGRAASARHPHPDGLVLGWLGRRLLQTPREDNLLLLGVQRSGKTSTVMVPTLLAWRGAAVATSTKEELVRLTGPHRSRLGPAHVFAPLDQDPAWVERLGLTAAAWNPVREAGTAAAAAEIADLFTASGKAGPSAFWYLAAATLLTGLLLRENALGGDLRSLLRVLNRTPHHEYVGLASELGEGTAGELLSAYANSPEKEAGSVASTLRSCLSLWIDDRVAGATSAAPAHLDVEDLLDSGGTLYLVAPAEEAERCRPLFSALLQTLLRRATARARRQGGTLSPRLLLALDEAANFARIPRLASYVSTGPGQGIQSLLCFHDLAQVEQGYGREGARTIWNNCRARLLLPGQGDLETLDRFTRTIGEETRSYRTTSSGGGRATATEQRIGRPLVPAGDLRRLEDALLLYAGAPPARLVLRRWDQVPAWRSLVQAPSSPSAAGLRPAREASHDQP